MTSTCSTVSLCSSKVVVVVGNRWKEILVVLVILVGLEEDLLTRLEEDLLLRLMMMTGKSSLA